MLHLLLDEHISPAVAREAAGKCPGLRIQAFQHWQAGRFLGAPDRVLLPEAIKARLCLVTYDQKTIRPLLKEWAEQGVHHTGVIFVDAKTIPPQDLGGLVKALCRLWTRERQADWTNRVVFLTRVED